MACHDEQERRDGTGQLHRFLKALDPTADLLDDRKIEDILVFAKEYADLVRFYDLDEVVEPDDARKNNQDQSQQAKQGGVYEAAKKIFTWKEFFSEDIAVVVASLTQYKSRLDDLKQNYDEKRRELDDELIIERSIEKYDAVFDDLLQYFQQIDDWYNTSINDHPLRKELEIMIRSVLQPVLIKLASYDKGSHLIRKAKKEPFDGRASAYRRFKSDPWELQYDSIQPDESIYSGPSPRRQITNAGLYVDDIFLAIFKVYKELTERTTFYLEAAFEHYPEHQPHMALFIAFLRLFEYARKEMNALAGRHLQFYYRDVLRLKEKPASPDAVYLIYELAKEASEFVLKKDTAFTAGKDLLGKELIYKTDAELVVNKARVTDLKTIYFQMNRLNSTSTEFISKIYAAPVARSQDGLGAPFKNPETAWPSLGYFKPEVENNEITNQVGKEADLGFAIASPQLFLAEGWRRISVLLPGLILSSLQGFLQIQLTGEKEWLQINIPEEDIIERETIDGVDFDVMKNTTPKRYFIIGDTIVVTLQATEPAVAPYDTKIHGDGYDTRLPLIKFIITDTLKYEALKDARLQRPRIDVEVENIKNILVRNDDGVIDPLKPFHPFSLNPKPNSALIIGSKEISMKRINTFNVAFERKMSEKKLNDLSKFEFGDFLFLHPDFFRQNKWNSLLNDPAEFDFFGEPIEINDLNTVPVISSFPRNYVDGSGGNNVDVLRLGFHVYVEGEDGGVRLQDPAFNTQFINADPIDRFQRSTALTLVLETNEITVGYSSLQDYEPGTEQFFHLYPFGIVETLPVEFTDNPNVAFEQLKIKKQNLLIRTDYLLPQIRFGSNNDNLFGENQYLSAFIQQGNLYIGIEDLSPPQNLSLLFKIADGTEENTDLEPPKINWSYLVNNEWRPLSKENLVSDSTYGLQTTGIILFDFPGMATVHSTIVTKGLHWLCASVDVGPDRFPKIIDVIAQANKAVFFNQQNDPEHFRNPLPASTIAKLVTKQPEIKTIRQPFESFDGKMQEEGKGFYTRSSERLRHKNRAITAWDYEHLVLERFPWVYKVKCISHTDPECLCRHLPVDITKCCCAQVAPGHVLIVPVSNLRNKNAVDILKPRTSRRILIQIEEYLRKFTSTFVRVHAKNPLFEEIKTCFNVKFHTGTDKGRYLKELNEDIIKFLTPWAFDQTKEIVFGGIVYGSSIINFIEGLDYVDYITCFRMIHIAKGCCAEDTLPDISCADIRLKEGGDDRLVNEIQATSTRAILTSAKQHCIDLIEEDEKIDECHCT